MLCNDRLYDLADEAPPPGAVGGRDAITICCQLSKLESETQLLIREGGLCRQLLPSTHVESMEHVFQALWPGVGAR